MDALEQGLLLLGQRVGNDAEDGVPKSRWMPGQVLNPRLGPSPPHTVMQGTQPLAAGEKGEFADKHKASCLEVMGRVPPHSRKNREHS